MTLKNRTKGLKKAIAMYRRGRIPFHVFHHLTGDILAGHSRRQSLVTNQRSV